MRRGAVAVAVVLAALLAGCGGADGSAGSSTAAVSSTTAAATSVPSKRSHGALVVGVGGPVGSGQLTGGVLGGRRDSGDRIGDVDP